MTVLCGNGVGSFEKNGPMSIMKVSERKVVVSDDVEQVNKAVRERRWFTISELKVYQCFDKTTYSPMYFCYAVAFSLEKSFTRAEH